MYKKSIKENSKYLIPFTFGIKYFGSDEIEHGSGTLMAINSDGYVLTCKHIATEFLRNHALGESYSKLLKELKEDRKSTIKKYNLKKDTVVLTNISLPFAYKTADIIIHKTLDLAIIHFHNVKFNLENYPVFSETQVEIGQSLCKLGFAFPEYDFYEYSESDHNIVLKDKKKANFPLFPLDGIATRYIDDGSTFETSTPGLKGQSGGPVFSPEGTVYGIQSMTKQLDMNLDVNVDVKRGLDKVKVNYNPFLNLGIEVSSVKIIEFLKENKVDFRSK